VEEGGGDSTWYAVAEGVAEGGHVSAAASGEGRGGWGGGLWAKKEGKWS
jgi:hypothetical protein